MPIEVRSNPVRSRLWNSTTAQHSRCASSLLTTTFTTARQHSASCNTMRPRVRSSPVSRMSRSRFDDSHAHLRTVQTPLNALGESTPVPGSGHSRQVQRGLAPAWNFVSSAVLMYASRRWCWAAMCSAGTSMSRLHIVSSTLSWTPASTPSTLRTAIHVGCRAMPAVNLKPSSAAG